MNRLLGIGRGILRHFERVPVFATEDVVVGRNVAFGRNVVFNCWRVRIGDGVVFGDNVTINASSFEIGDFGTVYSHCFFPGPGDLRIGHNVWLGTACIVDCQGGTVIGHNVGVGAHSQLWTHMAFGDRLAGCRFHSVKPLVVGNDVWFVGHCLVSPITAGDRSLAMLGSVVVHDMEPNHCYAGVPATDITARVGPQFAEVLTAEKIAHLSSRIAEFARGEDTVDVGDAVRIAGESGDYHGPPGVTVFNVADRMYTKTGSSLEQRLIRFLLPDAKFIPVPSR